MKVVTIGFISIAKAALISCLFMLTASGHASTTSVDNGGAVTIYSKKMNDGRVITVTEKFVPQTNAEVQNVRELQKDYPVTHGQLANTDFLLTFTATKQGAPPEVLYAFQQGTYFATDNTKHVAARIYDLDMQDDKLLFIWTAIPSIGVLYTEQVVPITGVDHDVKAQRVCFGGQFETPRVNIVSAELRGLLRDGTLHVTVGTVPQAKRVYRPNGMVWSLADGAEITETNKGITATGVR